MLAALILVSVLALVATVATAVLWSSRRALQRRCVDVQTERDELLRQADSFKGEINDLGKQLVEAQTRLAGIDDKFKALATDVLRQIAEQLRRENKSVFEGEQKEIEGIVKPIKELLTKAEQQIQAIEKERKEDKGGLTQLLHTMTADQKQLRSETANLVKALRQPHVRGRWGEVQLKRVAELAGMIEHCDFTEQLTLADGRPDMVIHLPANRQIVIDAKTPLDAYLSALECESDESRRECLARHVRHVKERVEKLASKAYQSQLQRTPDFVVLFIPGEPFLQAAVECEPTLIEKALESKVVIATPSTLLALLKAVAFGWKEQMQAENAERISDLGKEMHKRIGDLVDNIGKLGNAMNSTVKHYNAMIGSLETRVMPQARRFKELGADTPKELPAEGQLPVVEVRVREVKAEVE